MFRRKPAPPTHDPREFAWHVHHAQEAWTAKVDVKASLVLALVAGGLFATLPQLAGDWRLLAEAGPRAVARLAGVGALFIALAIAAAAVFPLLGQRAKHEDDGLIYFGHLRHYDTASLSERLSSLDPEAETRVLAQQLINMASRNWLKHRLLQGSLIAASIGMFGILVAQALPVHAG